MRRSRAKAECEQWSNAFQSFSFAPSNPQQQHLQVFECELRESTNSSSLCPRKSKPITCAMPETYLSNGTRLDACFCAPCLIMDLGVEFGRSGVSVSITVQLFKLVDREFPTFGFICRGIFAIDLHTKTKAEIVCFFNVRLGFLKTPPTSRHLHENSAWIFPLSSRRFPNTIITDKVQMSRKYWRLEFESCSSPR